MLVRVALNSKPYTKLLLTVEVAQAKVLAVTTAYSAGGALNPKPGFFQQLRLRRPRRWR